MPKKSLEYFEYIIWHILKMSGILVFVPLCSMGHAIGVHNFKKLNILTRQTLVNLLNIFFEGFPLSISLPYNFQKKNIYQGIKFQGLGPQKLPGLDPCSGTKTLKFLIFVQLFLGRMRIGQTKVDRRIISRT